MRPLFQILALLSINKVSYCFQHQGKHGFYNISIDDPNGKPHAYHSREIDQIEQYVEVMWGDLLDEKPQFDKSSLKPLFTPPNCTVIPKQGMPKPF